LDFELRSAEPSFFLLGGTWLSSLRLAGVVCTSPGLGEEREPVAALEPQSSSGQFLLTFRVLVLRVGEEHARGEQEEVPTLQDLAVVLLVVSLAKAAQSQRVGGPKSAPQEGRAFVECGDEVLELVLQVDEEEGVPAFRAWAATIIWDGTPALLGVGADRVRDARGCWHAPAGIGGAIIRVSGLAEGGVSTR